MKAEFYAWQKQYEPYKNAENGQSEPTLTNLVKSADLFDVSADYLPGRTDL